MEEEREERKLEEVKEDEEVVDEEEEIIIQPPIFQPRYPSGRNKMNAANYISVPIHSKYPNHRTRRFMHK